MKKMLRTVGVVLLLLLSVCIGEHAEAMVSLGKSTTYVVKRGDTLSGLFGKAYRKVALTNGIKNPDRIFPGQRLTVPDGTTVRMMTVSGFRKTVIEGDFHWNPGADKLSAVPKNGSKALRLAVPDLAVDEAAVLWGLLACSPENGRFVVENGRLIADLDDGTRLDMRDGIMVGGHSAIRYKGDLRLGKPLPETGLTAMRVGDRWVVNPKVCLNVASGTPVAVQPVSSSGESSISAFPEKNEGNERLKWELISGVGTWDNALAHGDWLYGEGAVLVPLGDGYSVGAGFYGMRGSGESETSSYSWDESGFGPQLVFRRDYLKEHVDEYGQTELWPAGWGLKARYIPNDYVSGGSGSYEMSQVGKKFGLYGEVYERTSEDWEYGLIGEYWTYFDGEIRSTWKGDSPQDRGSWNANAYAQYSFDKDWSLRGIVGMSHQNWDGLNYLNVTPEVRYRSWLRFGPRFSLALNKPEEFYRDADHGDLFTVGAFVRVELGDVIRDADRENRQDAVERVGVVGYSDNIPDTVDP